MAFDDEKNMGLADGVANDAKNIERTARQAIKAAQAVGKAAAGDYVGAAKDAVESGLIGKVVGIVVAILFALVLLTAHAVPYLVHEELSTAFKAPTTLWEAAGDLESVDADRATVFDQFFTFLKLSLTDIFGGKTTEETINDAWAKKLGIELIPEDADVNDSSFDAENFGDGNGYEVAQTQSSMETVLWRKIKACQTKVNARALQIETEIKARTNQLGGLAASAFAAAGHDQDKTITGYQYVVSVTERDTYVSDAYAVRLMALYSVQAGGHIDTIDVSEFMYWLGYKTKGAGKDVYEISDGRMTLSLDKWAGTCLPQYLMERCTRDEKDLLEVQKLLGGDRFVASTKYSDMTKEELKEVEAQLKKSIKSYSDYAVPVADLLFQVTVGEPFEEIYEDEEAMERERRLVEAIVRAKYPLLDSTDPEDRLILDDVRREFNAELSAELAKLKTLYRVRYTFPISIVTRSIDSLESVLGLWDGQMFTYSDTNEETTEAAEPAA